MKSLRYLAMLGILFLPLMYSQAQVRVGVGIGIGGGYGPSYVQGPPSCPYGYYPDYPYDCAPYGYYGPSYFVGGVFIGAGPWYHGYGNSYYGRPVYNRGYYSRGFYDRDDHRFYDRDRDGNDRGFQSRGFERHAPVANYRSNRGGHRDDGNRRGDGRR